MNKYSDQFSAVDDLGMVLQLVQSPLPVLMCFVAEWSGASHLLNTVIKDVVDSYNRKVLFYYVDMDSQKEIISYFGIRKVPTLLFFKGGEVIDFYEGAISTFLLTDKLNSMLDR